MSILGLDLGQQIGWVKGAAVGPIRNGVFKDMPNTTDLGKWLAGSDGFFRAILPGVTAIAVEQPFLGDSYWPARKLLAMLGHVHYWAHFHGIGVIEEIPVATGKLTLAGHGAASKERMIAAAVEWGLTDPEEHDADALGIWKTFVFGKRVPPPKARSRSGPVTIISPGTGNG
jgi:hypothetical protein